VTVFELARVMGTSVRMIEKHYGALVDGAHAWIVARLDALEAELEEAVDAASSKGSPPCSQAPTSSALYTSSAGCSSSAALCSSRGTWSPTT
jgi:hypothetical protein